MKKYSKTSPKETVPIPSEKSLHSEWQKMQFLWTTENSARNKPFRSYSNSSMNDSLIHINQLQPTICSFAKKSFDIIYKSTLLLEQIQIHLIEFLVRYSQYDDIKSFAVIHF